MEREERKRIDMKGGFIGPILGSIFHYTEHALKIGISMPGKWASVPVQFNLFKVHILPHQHCASVCVNPVIRGDRRSFSELTQG